MHFHSTTRRWSTSSRWLTRTAQIWLRGAIAPGSAEYCAAAQIAAGFPDVPFPSGWKANLSGVDLNLNYPARWEEARQHQAAKGFGRPRRRGLPRAGRPLDQPETAALAAYAACIRPDLMLALHTQAA